MKKFDQLSTYLPKLEVGLPHTALTDYTDYTVANMPIYIAMWLQRFVMRLDGFWIKKWECKDRVEWIPFRLLWLIYVLKMFEIGKCFPWISTFWINCLHLMSWIQYQNEEYDGYEPRAFQVIACFVAYHFIDKCLCSNVFKSTILS